MRDVWLSPELVHYTCIYTFSGALAPEGILLGPKFTLRPSIVFFYIGSVSLLHGSPAAGVSQNLRRATRNGITEHS